MDAPVNAYDKRMAARYDEDFEAIFGGRDRGDLEFFRGLARATDGPIVEVGAGTGRVLLALAEVADPSRVLTGVEPSAAMRELFADKIERLALRAEPEVAAPGTSAERLRIAAGSFSAVPLPDASQGLAFAAFRSFQHVLEVEGPDGQLAALAELRRVLRPGGTLALDLIDPAYAMLTDALPAVATRYRTARGTRVERWDGRRVDRLRQLIEVSFRWVEKAGTSVVAADRASYSIRYTFPWELRHLVARAGFVDIDVRATYDGALLGEVARDLVLTARTP